MDRVLFPVALAALLAAGTAVADHDDGDDVKEYRYVLQFDAKELAPFAGYVILDGSDMDSAFEVVPRIGGTGDRSKPGSATEITLLYSGSIPVTIEAIPGLPLVAKAEGWVRQEASRATDRSLWMEPAVLKRFETAFGEEVHRLSYARSPLLGKMLGLAKCKMHFLEGPKDRLKLVREHVALRYDSPRQARILPVSYVLEYGDGSKTELTAEKAAGLTEAECRRLLNPAAARPKAAASRRLPDGLWDLCAPSFAAAMLAGLAIRRRRDATGDPG